jgi:hypothetical protein
MALLSGCVTSREVAKVPFVPIANPITNEPVGREGVRLGSVSVRDERRNSGPRKETLDATKLVNQRSADRLEADGSYALERPLAEDVSQSFDAGLRRRGITLDPAAPDILQVSILRVEDRVECCTGLLQTYVIKLSVEVDATLYDNAAQRVLWTKRVRAIGDVTAKGLYFSADDYMRALPGILDDLVGRVVSEKGFLEALK